MEPVFEPAEDDDADVVEGVRVIENDPYATFFDNVRAGKEWREVKAFIKQHPEKVSEALEYAVKNHDVKGVEELLSCIEEGSSDILGHALSNAIQEPETDDMTEIIKCIIDKDRELLVRGVPMIGMQVSDTLHSPIWLALHCNCPRSALYMYSRTPLDEAKTHDYAGLISLTLRFKYLDISLKILRRFPKLCFATDHQGDTLLNTLADCPGLFVNANQLGIWEGWIYKYIHTPQTTHKYSVIIHVQKEATDHGNQKHLLCKVACFSRGLLADLRHISGISRIYEMKLLHHQALGILEFICEVSQQKYDEYLTVRPLVEEALFKAVERGNTPIINRLLQSDSTLWSTTEEHGKNIFQYAAEHRQEESFDVIYQLLEKEYRQHLVGMKDEFGNNMLHTVGKLFSQLTQIDHIRGAALQMQKELYWFKKVESMASVKDLNHMNSDGLTPREVFTMNHRDLVKKGESAMKEIATSSSFVGALIITIMFAAAVTVPGGTKGC